MMHRHSPALGGSGAYSTTSWVAGPKTIRWSITGGRKTIPPKTCGSSELWAPSSVLRGGPDSFTHRAWSWSGKFNFGQVHDDSSGGEHDGTRFHSWPSRDVQTWRGRSRTRWESRAQRAGGL